MLLRKSDLLAVSLFVCPAFLGFSCSDSSSSKTPAVQTPSGEENTPAVQTPSGEENTPASGATENPLQLTGASLEFQKLQFDCGDVLQPIADASVSSLPSSLVEVRTLAATIPAKDKALLTLKIQDGGVVCDYRAQFAVNKGFSEITFESSQALNAAGASDCATARAQWDSALSEGPVPFDYDRTFIRWVAVRLPETLQKSPVCPSGPLRAVFAAKL
jgi:hypothetical protein